MNNYFRNEKKDISNKQNFDFQILEINQKDIEDETFYDSDDDDETDISKYVIDIFGLNKKGETVYLEVNDFTPFFYIEVPEQLQKKLKKIHEKFMLEYLKEKIGFGKYKDSILGVKLIRKKKFYGFTNNKLFKFFQIHFRSLKAMSLTKNFFKFNKVFVKDIAYKAYKYNLYESNIIPYLRFCHILNIKTSGWVRLPKNKFKQKNLRLSKCQYEFEINWKKIISLDEITEIAPIMIASFDIECISIKDPDKFPNANNKEDAIIQIGTTVTMFNNPDYLLKNIITLNTCEKFDDDSEIIECKTEKQVIIQWCKMINKLDPDIITGYNIFGFDFEYIWDRAKLFKIEKHLLKLGRYKFEMEEDIVEKTLSSSALGINNLKYINMKGRILIDLYKYVQRTQKLENYKLNTVAKKFLGSQKDDVSYKDIFKFQFIDAHHRGIIAKYCVQDCKLCNDLIERLCVLPNEIGMANATSVPLSFIFNRGQGIKILSKVSEFCRRENTLMIVLNPDEIPKCSYKGATVLNANRGAHYFPITCLDFASLYPSCMLSHNLCISSLVMDKKYDNLKGIEYHKSKWFNIHKVVDLGFDPDKVKKFGEYEKKHEIDIESVLSSYEKLRNTKIVKDYKLVKKIVDAYKEGYFIEEYKFAQPEKEMIDGRLTPIKEQLGILPKIELELLALRNQSKKKMKKFDKPKDGKWKSEDKFMYNIYNGLQLAYKVVMNSIYGAMGASFGAISCKPVAGSICTTGRELLEYSRDKILGLYPGSKAIYGDSVTGDTPILVRFPDGKISIRTIETLHNNWKPYEEFKPFDTNRKEKQQSLINLECWSSSGWTKIKRVIRHKTKKRIFRINTHCGVIDVTEDHSLLNENKEIIKSNDCKIGETKLLQNYPKFIKNNLDFNEIINNYNCKKTLEEKEAFIYGFFFGDGSCGKYNTKWGIKYSWALNNQDRELLELCLSYLNDLYGKNTDFKILETMTSSGVLKLVPKGYIKFMVDKFRSIFYDKDKLKIIPDKILNSEYNIRLNFFKGYYCADGSKCNNTNIKNIRFSNKGKISSAHLYYLVKSIGYKASLQIRKDKLDIYRITCTNGKQRKNPCIIKKIMDLGYNNENDFVYDIETEEGRFGAGIGEIIVKNTDSVFIAFKLPKDMKPMSIEARTLCWKLGEEAEKKMEKLIPWPHKLEYEKTYQPLILFSKKRYAGKLYEFQMNEPKKLDCKGIVLKRRDNANIVKKVYQGCLDLILEKDVNEAVKYLNKTLLDIINNHTKKLFPIQDFIITKTLKSFSQYKPDKKTMEKINEIEKILRDCDSKIKTRKLLKELDDLEMRKINQPHVMLAKRVKKRNPGNAFQSNDRVPYCYIQKKGKNLLQGDRVETPFYIDEKNLKLDYMYYIEKQLEKPVTQLFEHIVKDYEKLFDKIKKLGKNKKNNQKSILDIFKKK